MDVTIPPIIGPAIRCITDAPVPWVHIIGNKPAMMATTIISFGPDARYGSVLDGLDQSLQGYFAARHHIVPGMIEIQQHHDAGLCRNTRQLTMRRSTPGSLSVPTAVSTCSRCGDSRRRCRFGIAATRTRGLLILAH